MHIAPSIASVLLALMLFAPARTPGSVAQEGAPAAGTPKIAADGVEVITNSFIRPQENWYDDLFHHDHGDEVLVSRKAIGDAIELSIESKNGRSTSGVRTRLRFTMQESETPKVEAACYWHYDSSSADQPSEAWLTKLRGNVVVDLKALTESRLRVKFDLTGTAIERASSTFIVMGAVDVPASEER